MKLKGAVVLLVLALAALGGMAAAQNTAFIGTPYASLSAATATGPGTAFKVQPASYSYTWTVVTGGTVTSATVNFEGSLDGSTWYVLDVASTSDTNWSSGEMRHVVNKPTNYLRMNVVSIAGGGSLTGTFSLFR
ncbi:MAG: hypothetical protein CXZ00_02960 [Acidobacteria bacterium]|nr:MAG: hypothetical protein CXZ00_02960 [Acidobacteriota bacterium]